MGLERKLNANFVELLARSSELTLVLAEHAVPVSKYLRGEPLVQKVEYFGSVYFSLPGEVAQAEYIFGSTTVHYHSTKIHPLGRSNYQAALQNLHDCLKEVRAAGIKCQVILFTQTISPDQIDNLEWAIYPVDKV